MKTLRAILLAVFLVFLTKLDAATNVKTIADHKEFKKLTRVDTNVLVYFFDADLSNSDLKSNLRVLNEAANLAYGVGTIVVIDCRDAEGKKLCKKLKGVPTSGQYLLKHYANGEFHKDYDRQFNAKSIFRFLSDPQGSVPWEEDSTSKNVRHVESADDFNKMVTSYKGQILLMFYAPWCGHCNTLKPNYAAAADELKGRAVLAAVDATRPENSPIVSHFGVKGYPTLIYFNEGQFQFNYGGERTKEGIISWLKKPTPEQAKPEIDEKEREVLWAETVSDVVHLTDDNLDKFISENPSVLIMFYAPWCGHCKRAKPEYEKAAARLVEKNIKGILAAVDATVHKKISEKFNIEGFPTFKYFKNGEYAWDVNERTEDKIFEFMQNPKQPPPPEKPWSEMDTQVVHLKADNFKTILKKKRHALVLFYAAWSEDYKNLRTQFSEAAEKFADDARIVLAAVDCGKHHEVCQENNVPTLPYAIYWSFMKEKESFSGKMTKTNFVEFINKKEGSAGDEEKPKTETATPKPAPSGFDFDEKVHLGNNDNFDELIQTGKSLVMFFAPWCGHCKSAKPHFSEAARKLPENKGRFVAVDCTIYRELCQKFNVRGYPTFKIFDNGSPDDYRNGRTTDDFLGVFGESKKPDAAAQKPSSPPSSGFDLDEKVQVGSDKNFDDLVTSGKKSLVMFFAPWCGHCKSAKPAFSDAAKQLPEDKGQLIAVDCTVYRDLCQRFNVRGYPTFKVFESGKTPEDYRGGRSTDDFLGAFGVKPAFFDEAVKEGTNENFQKLISSGKSIAMFYAPWCGHCKNAKPAFNEAAKEVKNAQFIGVDCAIHQDLCREQKIGGYPSFKIFENGKFSSDHNGGRTKADFVALFPKKDEL